MASSSDNSTSGFAPPNSPVPTDETAEPPQLIDPAEPQPNAAEPQSTLSQASPVPTADDLTVVEARKLVLRALDTKICQQDDATALGAVHIACRLVSNISSQPSKPKFRKFRANNPTISKALLRCPGGVDLLLALGFRTAVAEFEEFWEVPMGPLLLRTLGEASIVLEHYLDLTKKKIDRSATLRREKLAGASLDRDMTLRAIADDKAERKDRNWTHAPAPGK